MRYAEKKIVRQFLIVLFFAMLVVYTVLYHVKGGERTQRIEQTATVPDQGLAIVEKNTNNTSSGTDTQDMEYDTSPALVSGSGNTEIGTTGQQIQNNTGNQQINNDINTGGNNDTPTIDSGVIILSGTDTYFGPIEPIDKLGVSYQYVLKDDKDIYFAYLGDNTYDFTRIARQLDGYIYIMNTEQEIVKNQLFGNKVTFINLPEYENQNVLIFVETDEGNRLISIGYPIYHQSKGYLQSLFNE